MTISCDLCRLSEPAPDDTHTDGVQTRPVHSACFIAVERERARIVRVDSLADEHARARRAAAPRFFIEHDVIHDRVTGKHVRTSDNGLEDGIQECCDLLNDLADTSQQAIEREMEAAGVDMPAFLSKVRSRVAEVQREATDSSGATAPGGPLDHLALPASRSAVDTINAMLGLGGAITHKGDELKCSTHDEESGVSKTYLGASECHVLARAFAALSAAFTRCDHRVKS